MSAKRKQLVRIWFLIDLLGIGLSCFLILAYVFYGHRFKFSQDLSDTWIIIGLVSLGAWISVRVIHNIFKHKRHFSNRRYRVLSFFENFLNNAGNVLLLTPFHSKRYVHRLAKQHKYFRIGWLKQKRVFSNSEVKQVQRLMKLQRSILEICQDINQVRAEDEQEIHLLKSELKTQMKSYSENLDHLRFDIRNEV